MVMSNFVLMRDDKKPRSNSGRTGITPRYPLIRVIDESGEDYLYPEDFFLPIGLSCQTETPTPLN